MQATGGDNESGCISKLNGSAARERKAEPSGMISARPPEHNDAAVHMLDQRRIEALKALDERSFSRFHLKVCLVAGVGFLTDAYDIFAIDLAYAIWGHNRLYGMELIIVVITAFAMSLAGFELGLYALYILIIWFIMGIVAGEDHPLSAVITSEFASTGSLGRLVPTVFTPEGWEKLADSLAALVWGVPGGARESGNGRQRRAERRRRERASRRLGGLK